MNDWFGRKCHITGPIVCKICEKAPIDCDCISPIMKEEFRIADQLRRVLNLDIEKKTKK